MTSDPNSADESRLTAQLTELVRQQFRLHDEMMSLSGQGPNDAEEVNAAFAWAELHNRYKRLQTEIDEIRRQLR